jgi:hypothetical protein
VVKSDESGRCSFCNRRVELTQLSEWPCEPFEIVRVEHGPDVTTACNCHTTGALRPVGRAIERRVFSGPWLACRACHFEIDSENWGMVAERAMSEARVRGLGPFSSAGQNLLIDESGVVVRRIDTLSALAVERYRNGIEQDFVMFCRHRVPTAGWRTHTGAVRVTPATQRRAQESAAMDSGGVKTCPTCGHRMLGDVYAQHRKSAHDDVKRGRTVPDEAGPRRRDPTQKNGQIRRVTGCQRCGVAHDPDDNAACQKQLKRIWREAPLGVPLNEAVAQSRQQGAGRSDPRGKSRDSIPRRQVGDDGPRDEAEAGRAVGRSYARCPFCPATVRTTRLERHCRQVHARTPVRSQQARRSDMGSPRGGRAAAPVGRGPDASRGPARKVVRPSDADARSPGDVHSFDQIDGNPDPRIYRERGRFGSPPSYDPYDEESWA